MIAVYPAVEKGIVDFKECEKEETLRCMSVFTKQEPEAELVCKEQDKEKAVYELKLVYPGEKLSRCVCFSDLVRKPYGSV